MAYTLMTCMRDSIAVPTWNGMTHEEDLGRELSPQGIDAATLRRAALGTTRYDVVCTSPARRAQVTASALMGLTDQSAVRLVEELCYDGPDTPRGKWLAEQYEELGFRPYRAYYKRDTESHLAMQGGKALRQCIEAAESANAKNVLVVTHMPILPCLGMTATAGVNRKWDSMFADHAFKESEGFTLTLDGGSPVDVKFHTN